MLNISQEEIAERLNVTSQAISKWECDKSYPDMEMLIQIAQLFNISLDSLILGEGFSKSIAGVPDDNCLRLVLCRGKQVIEATEPNSVLRVELGEGTDELEGLEIWGSASINGDVFGNISAGGSVNCDRVEGNITAGAGVNCDEVEGDITAGAGINCDGVNGNVSAGTNIVCDDIGGDVTCGLTLQCDNIAGGVSCGMTITCDSITGNISECMGDIHVKTLNGTVEKCEKAVYIKEES